MKYVIDVVPTKNGNNLFKIYALVDGKKCFVTSFFENRYNHKAVKYIIAKENEV